MTSSSFECEVCGATGLRKVIDLGNHPMCDDLVPVGDPGFAIEYPIEIAFCDRCKTAHQLHQIPKQKLFPQTYHYRARHTADVLNGMRQLVERCERQLGSVDGVTVLDIGCNDGSLLSIFSGKGAKVVGVEPTGAASDAASNAIHVYHDFFTKDIADTILKEHGAPDIITFTNVFAHIEDLKSLISATGSIMAPHTILVIENHYLGSVLEKAQFDTFYHEHPRTYSLTSFLHIAKALDASLVSAEFPERYGGNIRVIIRKEPTSAHESMPETGERLELEAGFGEQLKRMAAAIPAWQDRKRAEIDGLVAQHGPLSGKAFPGRAAILVKLLGLNEKMLSAVYEKPGSAKIGHYIPGTRIPIVSDDEFAARHESGTPVLNLAWHISSEISGYLRQRGLQDPIVDIFSAEEFNRLG